MTNETPNIETPNSLSDIDPYATDAGETTQSNYKFQSMCIGLIALQMYGGDTEYEEIFCELYEDAIALKKNKRFVGIQIKHRERGLGAFLLTNDPILKSITRFIEHEKNYPNKFDKFIIASNMPINIKQNQSATKLFDYCKNENIDSDMESFLLKISKKIKFDKLVIKRVLAKTGYTKMPDRDSMINEIKDYCSRRIVEYKNKEMYQLQKFAELITEMVQKKSVKFEGSLSDYFEFMSDSQRKRSFANLNHKRITKKEIETIILDNTKMILLDTDFNWPSKRSFPLIKKKMALGGIHMAAIKSITALAINVFEYFISKEHEDMLENHLRINDNELKNMLVILDEQCSQAETSARLTQTPFGLKKLEIIDQKLEQLIKNRHRDVNLLPFEILKGFVGLRIMECTVNFSDEPIEGFT